MILFVLILVAVAFVVGVFAMRFLRRRGELKRRERTRGEIRAGLRCTCGYDLLQTDTLRCPECGNVPHFDTTPEKLGLSADELRRAKAAADERRRIAELEALEHEARLARAKLEQAKKAIETGESPM
jgi:hypothetical protein